MSSFLVEKVAWGDAGFQAAKDAEFSVFGVANNFVSREDLDAGEMLTYKSYEVQSEFYTALDPCAESRQPAGIIRFIRFDPARGCDSFSTLKDARSYSVDGAPATCLLDANWDRFFQMVDLSTIGELATLAVAPGYRRRGVAESMWDALLTASNRDGVAMWTAALVVPLYAWYKKILPNAIESIGSLMPQYVGADSIPVVIRVDHPEVSEFHRQFRGGIWGCIPARAERKARQS